MSTYEAKLHVSSIFVLFCGSHSAIGYLPWCGGMGHSSKGNNDLNVVFIWGVYNRVILLTH